MNNNAATPLRVPQCYFCGAYGEINKMRKWSTLRSFFFHKECEQVLRMHGAIRMTMMGYELMDVASIKDVVKKLFPWKETEA